MKYRKVNVGLVFCIVFCFIAATSPLWLSLLSKLYSEKVIGEEDFLVCPVNVNNTTDGKFSISFLSEDGKVQDFITDEVYVSDTKVNTVTFHFTYVEDYRKPILFLKEKDMGKSDKTIDNIEKAIEKRAFKVEVTAETYDKLTSAE